MIYVQNILALLDITFYNLIFHPIYISCTIFYAVYLLSDIYSDDLTNIVADKAQLLVPN